MLNILHRVGIKAPSSEVFQALATTEGIAAWWTRETSGESKPGGVVVTRFFADGKLLGGFDLAVDDLVPDRRVAWRVVEGPAEWIGTRICFELGREDGFTVILFRHEGWKEEVPFMSHCSTKWGSFLMSLKAYVETGTGQPSPDDVRIGNWH